MKKLLLFLVAMALGFGVKAQTPLTQAVDFTATDVHGTEVHLFDILDGGQFVLIDFFFTTCGPCQNAAPKLVESYYAFGCNMHDVYYMEISDRDSDAACLNWVNNYGVEYPTISGVAGGSISDQYGIPAFPTVILIAPDHSIVIQDLYPIPNAQTVINALEAKGVEQHECNPEQAGEYYPETIRLFPNPANDFVTLKGELGVVSVYNTLGQKVDEFYAEGNELKINTEKYEDGVYVIKANENTLRFVVKH